MSTTLETASEHLTQPVNQAAVVEAALRTIQSVNDSHEYDYIDVAKAIQGNQKASEELGELLWFTGTEG
jgi:hypothetical protein